MARLLRVQAQVRGVLAQNSVLYEQTRLSQLHVASGDFGVAVKLSTERGGNQPRRTIADRPTVDFHHRKHDLARRGDEGLPRGMRLLQREGSLFELEPLRRDRFKQDRAGDTAQDGMVGL